MNTYLQFLADHWKQMLEGTEAIGANVYAFYAFIANHGGVRTMLANFLGPKNPQPQPPKTP